MKPLALIGALALGLSLTGCVTPFDTTSVTTRQVALAAGAFNVVEATATAYLRLPACPAAPICRSAAVVAAIDPVLRDGYAARKRLVAAARSTSGAPVSVSDFTVLTGAVTDLKALFAQYGIGA